MVAKDVPKTGQTTVSPLVITGASGFVGRALVRALPAAQFPDLRVLVHRRMDPKFLNDPRITTVHGNLLDRATLRGLVTPGATVVHLAYLESAQPELDNVAAAHNLVATCRVAGIRRMIYCSTAAVFGKAPDDIITEATPCRPRNAYERTKYRLENELREGALGRHEVAILRPAAVFGPGGRNLMSLATRILLGDGVLNYAYACVQGRRHLHLTSVHNVASALAFLCAKNRRLDEHLYIVADDDSPMNNYEDVECFLRQAFNLKRYCRVVALPPVILSMLLKLRARSDTNPSRLYSDQKLKSAGFVKPWAFDRAVAEFASWFLAETRSLSGSVG